MKQITITFTNSLKQDKTATFDIYTKSERADYREARYVEPVVNADMISGDDWLDEDFAEVEKAAAQQAGIALGEKFYYIRRA